MELICAVTGVCVLYTHRLSGGCMCAGYHLGRSHLCSSTRNCPWCLHKCAGTHHCWTCIHPHLEDKGLTALLHNFINSYKFQKQSMFYSQRTLIINRFGNWSQILGIFSTCNKTVVKLLEHMWKKEIKHDLTQAVVSIVCQMKSIVTCAAIVARYIVAFVDTTTIKLQVTLINVWETTEKSSQSLPTG